jgi:hypothetical protein
MAIVSQTLCSLMLVHFLRLSSVLPWNIPPLDDLSHYASLASASFLPSIPVVHNGTLCLSDLPPHTVFALSVTGAAYEREGQAGRSFSDDMLTKKRVFNVRNFNNKLNSEIDRFGSLQSMLLYQLLGFFHRDEDREWQVRWTADLSSHFPLQNVHLHAVFTVLS